MGGLGALLWDPERESQKQVLIWRKDRQEGRRCFLLAMCLSLGAPRPACHPGVWVMA